MIRRLLIALLVLAAPATAQTQAQMNTDAARAWRTADAALNAQWQRTLGFMRGLDGKGPPSGHAGVLLAAQRAWLSFRDNHCGLTGARYAGGSMAGMVVVQCKTDLTRERTRQLKDLTEQR